MSFSIQTEKDNKLSFLGVKIIRKQNKLKNTIYIYKNLLLVAHIATLKVFYLRFINLVWYTL